MLKIGINSFRFFKQRLSFLIISVLGMMLSIVIPAETVRAQGDLMITPGRVVFNGVKKRTQILNLANTGKDTARYVVSLVENRMTELGNFENITEADPGQRFASPYLRFFPRTVVLPPHEAQVVKVQLMKTNLLTEGEYRSHIYFRAVPDEEPLGADEVIEDTTAVAIKLKAVFGITIPVIIRIGKNDSDVEVDSIVFNMYNDTLPVLSFNFNRTGKMSVYGQLTVVHVSPGGKKTKVGFVKGIAIYTPNKKRKFKMALKTDEGVDFSKGKLILDFKGQTNTGRKNLATEEFSLE